MSEYLCLYTYICMYRVNPDEYLRFTHTIQLQKGNQYHVARIRVYSHDTLRDRAHRRLGLRVNPIYRTYLNIYACRVL